MTRKRKLAVLGAGILALGVSIAAALESYKDYLNDPDLFAKVTFDILGKSQREPSCENKLFELFSNKDPTFQRELENETQHLLKKYKIDLDKRWENQNDTRFRDADHFLSYMKGGPKFLKKSFDKGYFLDAAIIARHQGLNSNQTNLLLEKSYIQTYLTRSFLHDSKLNNLEGKFLEDFTEREWIRQMFNELKIMKKMSNKEILSKYGDTKKHLFSMIEKKYHTYQERSTLSEELSRIYSELLY